MAKAPRRKDDNRYLALVERIFFDRYVEGKSHVDFERADLETAAKSLKVELPKNLGDVIYSMRYRIELPD